MKRIFTSAAILIGLLNNSKAQDACNIVTSTICSNVIDNFSTNPTAKNFELSGFQWSGSETSGQSLWVPSASFNSDYLFTTPAYYLTGGGVVNVGFTISSWNGSNNYFSSNFILLDIEYIDASTNTTLETCEGIMISSANSYCFQRGSSKFTAGIMLKYRFTFHTSADVTGTKVIIVDNLAVGSAQQATLPVTFMSITGTKVTEGNKISWTVGAETNVNRYEIEESSNGKSYTLIGQVPATGASAYSFIDVLPGTATTYYRVKSKDIDGYTKISPVITIKATTTKGGKGKIALGAYPTPTTSELIISHDEADLTCALTIMSVDGRMVKTFVPTKGSIQTTVNMSAMQPGMYFVRYQAADGEIETIKVVKQ
jgi:hypothetical protein